MLEETKATAELLIDPLILMGTEQILLINCCCLLISYLVLKSDRILNIKVIWINKIGRFILWNILEQEKRLYWY